MIERSSRKPHSAWRQPAAGTDQRFVQPRWEKRTPSNVYVQLKMQRLRGRETTATTLTL